MAHFSCHFRPNTMERRNASTTPGSKKPPIKATPLNKEQHSQYRAAVGQVIAMGQPVENRHCLRCQRVEQVNEEDQRNSKQLLRYIKGTIHYKVKLEPKVEHSERGHQGVNNQFSFSADSDFAGCNTTRKSTSGSITMHWGVPLLHISRTQSTIALSSAEAELYAMGQATSESQHIKQVIEEMAIAEIDTDNDNDDQHRH
eukprot:6490529-Amphidinium_carterae.3